jgi:hypothetical protein
MWTTPDASAVMVGDHACTAGSVRRIGWAQATGTDCALASWAFDGEKDITNIIRTEAALNRQILLFIDPLPFGIY